MSEEERSLAERAQEGADVESLISEAFTGPLCRGGYEPREHQIRLAEGVARSAEQGGWLFAEAPCGSGKGAAYLVPGILAVLKARERWKKANAAARAAWDGDGEYRPPPPPKLVISTANIALQEQLVKKDIPQIAAALDVQLRVALMKGRNNYLCFEKLEEAEQVQWSEQGDNAEEIKRLIGWSKTSETGDREDLPFQVEGRSWGRLSVAGKDCTGKDCRFAKATAERRCFAEVARLGWKSAHILVCNHHLLSILPQGFPGVTLLAIDEAHELEEAIRSTQSMEVRRTHAKHHGGRLKRHAGRLAEICEVRIAKLADEFEAVWERKAGRFDSELELSRGWTRLDREYMAPLWQAVEVVGGRVEALQNQGQREEAGRARSYLRSLVSFAGMCISLIECEPFEGLQVDLDAPWAFWLEKKPGRGVIGLAAPADVAGGIWRLQKLYPSAVLTSATLATAGDFRPLRLSYGVGNLGEPGEVEDEVQVMGDGPCEEMVLPSPFPLDEMGLMVVPDGPSPKEEGWREWVGKQATAAIRAAGGRTLVLCTSNASMRVIAERARSELPEIPIRVQGEAGRTELRDWFAAAPENTLIASRSFFQGIDVQGEALSCVVLDRLPFAVPDHPLEKAVCELLIDRAGGGSGFTVRALPQCCTALAQASGRLIRSKTDRGALVVLDSRIMWKNATGRALRKSVPPFAVSREIEDVARLLAGERLGRTVRRPVTVKSRGRSLRPIRKSRRAE